MINSGIINTNTEQKPLHFPQPDVSTKLASDMQAEKVIKKARAMLSLQKQTNPKAMNLIQMAEIALKNGNHVSAHDFAEKVLVMLSLKNTDGPIKTDIHPVEPRIKKPATNPVESKKHTEHTYMDSSNDPGVSFSYPGKLTGPESFLAVPAHEYEHVRHSLREAMLNGEKVLVYVRYHVRYDPATGEPFMAGGVTRTIKFRDIPPPEKGNNVDMYV